MDSDAKQDSRDAISKNASSLASHLPCAKVAFTPLVPRSDSDLPPTSVSPASPNDGGQQGLNVINKGIKASMTHSPEDEAERAEELSLNLSKAAIEQPEHGSSLPLRGKQEELLVEAANVECSDEHPSYREAPALPVLVDPDPSDGANAKWPSQEAVSNIEMSVVLRSPESPAALTPPTLADPLPAYSLPRSSLELEFRLRWKPPDYEKESKRHACYAVNNKLQPSVIEHLTLPGTALTLSVSRSSLAYVTRAIPSRRPSFLSSLQVREQRNVITRRRAAKIVNNNSTSQSAGLNKRSRTHEAAFMLLIFPLASPRQVEAASRLGTELIWCARYKPHDVMGTIQQLSDGIGLYMSTARSPLYEAVRAIPVRLLLFLTRTVNPCRPNNELVGRVRKPPDVTECWLLDEAVNKTGNGGRRGSSPVSRPTSALHARLPRF
ncbi:hypothetical protein AX14_008626 [Amanita brunnescens Koide BX004]|nr:hypothetical protein AX14_008626 [Amanita brunnescens Koide BX004]